MKRNMIMAALVALMVSANQSRAQQTPAQQVAAAVSQTAAAAGEVSALKARAATENKRSELQSQANPAQWRANASVRRTSAAWLAQQTVAANARLAQARLNEFEVRQKFGIVQAPAVGRKARNKP